MRLSGLCDSQLISSRLCVPQIRIAEAAFEKTPMLQVKNRFRIGAQLEQMQEQLAQMRAEMDQVNTRCLTCLMLRFV